MYHPSQIFISVVATSFVLAWVVRGTPAAVVEAALKSGTSERQTIAADIEGTEMISPLLTVEHGDSTAAVGGGGGDYKPSSVDDANDAANNRTDTTAHK